MTPEALRLWMERRAPESHWRRSAIGAIGSVVNANLNLLADDKALLKLIDAAYPFGERKYLPYKMWLLERRLFIAACAVPATLPTHDEIGACEVAGDLVQLGRIDEARKLLDEQAPHRLGRKCPACGAKPGMNCDTFTEDGDPPARELLIPHHSRLVGYPDAGPLFRGH